MNHTTNNRKSRKIKLSTVLIPLAGFFIILAGLNGYQYFKLRANLAEPVINQISDAEIRELQNFFNSVANKLKIVRDWARNGVLDNEDVISLNKKLIPLIEHQSPISGVLLADNDGREYYLYPKDGQWVTRTRAAGQSGTLFYQLWNTASKSIRQWQEKSNYSPTSRPWFHRNQTDDSIYWTPMYTFHENSAKGISASVSWDTEKNKDSFTVFALDIQVKELQQLIQETDGSQDTTRFLVNPFSGEFILADSLQDDAVQQDSSVGHITKLISQWKATGKPAGELVRARDNKEEWLATFKPMLKKNSVIWLGVAASEKKLIDNLSNTLFAIDLVDLLVACTGGAAMLLLIWLNGGLRSSKQEEEDPVLRFHRLINLGEGNNIEFKSTVRMNLNKGKPGKEIEFAWLKAVVAFLNSDGGTLLLGVADNGKILGLEADNFENNDRCLLHIKNLFNHHIGAEFSDFVDFILLIVEDKKVVTVDCHEAGKPVFLRIGKNEEFYIRSGPSNSKLAPSQMLRYVQQKK
jgi:hypothetical protein